jgi:cell division protein FtsN
VGNTDAFVYFVQAGAYSRPDDAEQQRAKLAMLGLDARVTEREQSGRTVYRVRVGPFERRDDAESAQGRLADASVEANLVRVER